jgi:hypothetical protein
VKNSSEFHQSVGFEPRNRFAAGRPSPKAAQTIAPTNPALGGRFRALAGGTASEALDRIEPAKLAPSGRGSPEERHDLAGIRESLLPVLAEHQPVIDVHVEDTVRPFDQLRLHAESAAQLFRQADRLTMVVSRFAPDDFRTHLGLRWILV